MVVPLWVNVPSLTVTDPFWSSPTRLMWPLSPRLTPCALVTSVWQLPAPQAIGPMSTALGAMSPPVTVIFTTASALSPLLSMIRYRSVSAPFLFGV